MNNLPKNWCTDVCEEVVFYLNQKNSKNTIIGVFSFYGEENGKFCYADYTFGTYLTNKQFIEMSKEINKEEEIKVGDMVWVAAYSEKTAETNKKERKLLAILPEYILNRFVCENPDDYLRPCSWKFAIPIQKEEKKERTLLLTDAEWEKLQNIIK